MTKENGAPFRVDLRPGESVDLPDGLGSVTWEAADKDGNEVTYTLKRFAPNVELADGLFTFDKTKYPGVEVNDLR